MELEYTVEADDLARAIQLQAGSWPLLRWLSAFLRFLIAPLAVVVGLASLWLQGPSLRGVLLAAVGAILLVGAGRIHTLFYRNATASLLRSAPMAVGRKRLVADANGLSEHFEGGYVTFAWPSISRIADTAEVLVLFSGPGAIVVPRQRVHAGSVDALLSEVRSRLGPRAA